ncbi:MAG: glycoside hydrolase family 38 C-terminal domain-containing protein [Chloroflexota bacterium]
MSTPIRAHIINHTHWDREWFLTSEYTSRWIPRLVDKIEQIANENPDFRFLFDGQTLVIEDLLSVDPGYEPRVRSLLQSGVLQLGPYYCQPDWQLTGGELLIRNLMLGRQDVEALGGQPLAVGWLVDTFGHSGQAPQLHRLLGIDAVFVWRGSPLLEPYFTWRGADGSELMTINLFGGYRNLYGVTHAPEVALNRLQAEVKKLAPFYPTPDIPLFDGYDLEDDPEDPVRFYVLEFPDGLMVGGSVLELREATPESFARDIAQHKLDLPTVEGELNSGKYGATFPGTFSARTYLKLMAHDCEHLLFSVAEPLAVMARLHGRRYPTKAYESWTRKLLQNAVHDCICGVSIDQVHEKMVHSYRRLHHAMTADIEASLATTLADFRSATYAVSTNPFTASNWQIVGNNLFHSKTEGIGIWPVAAQHDVENISEPAGEFTWHNDHYTALLRPDGVLQLGDGRYGALIVSREHGDTYSAQSGDRLGLVQPNSPPILVQQSAHHAVVEFQGAWRGEQDEVSVDVRLTFDPSPLIRWEIDLDSRGADLRVDIVFATGLSNSKVYARMPFDLVKRPRADRDLLPAALSPQLSNVLLGQRELNAVTDFPFHDFVALKGGDQSVAILSRGLRSYRADDEGAIVLTLRRAVEWVTKADLPDRIGDAGPFFYVPDARCERRVRHEIGLVAGQFEPQSMTLQQLNAAFQNPPLIVHAGGRGEGQTWQLLQEHLPLSSLSLSGDSVLARFYNPTNRPVAFARHVRQTDLWGKEMNTVSQVAPGKIVTVRVPAPVTGEWEQGNDEEAPITLLTPPRWRDGGNQAQPEPAVLDSLQQKIDVLARQLDSVQEQVEGATGANRLRLQHRGYVLERELLEMRLSHALNRRKLEQGPSPNHEALYSVDPEIAEIGKALNRLRIKRRIFDYVVQAI